MRAGRAQSNDRCNVSDDDLLQDWLTDRHIEDVEAIVPDMAGAARGKVIPAGKFGTGSLKLPESIFQQTVSGYYINNPNNVEDRDMLLVPDPHTLRPVPWATDPAASVFLDCFRRDKTQVPTSPRGVLRNVLAKYEARGWRPVVAPEVEFYLISPQSDATQDAEPPEGRLGWKEGARQPFSIDTMNDFDPFINDVYAYCEDQGIRIDTLSQEAGPAQFEINFLHGDAVEGDLDRPLLGGLAQLEHRRGGDHALGQLVEELLPVGVADVELEPLGAGLEVRLEPAGYGAAGPAAILLLVAPGPDPAGDAPQLPGLGLGDRVGGGQRPGLAGPGMEQPVPAGRPAGLGLDRHAPGQRRETDAVPTAPAARCTRRRLPARRADRPGREQAGNWAR